MHCTNTQRDPNNKLASTPTRSVRDIVQQLIQCPAIDLAREPVIPLKHQVGDGGTVRIFHTQNVGSQLSVRYVSFIN